MKISQKHIQYILLLLIVVIAVCAYQFGYVKYIEKANAVKDENKTIEARINELNEKESHRTEWTDAIAQSEKDIKTILAKYGPGNSPEKSIIFVRNLEESAGIQVSNISFNTDSPIFVSSDTDESGNPKVEMDTTYIGLSYATTYDGLKKCMDYINTHPERMNVANFTANFDQETGQLAGNMIINLFSVKDEDHKYQAPVVSGVELGTENIFGTIDLFNLINPETGEPETGETGETGELGTGENQSGTE